MSEVSEVQKYHDAIAHEQKIVDQCNDIAKLVESRLFRKVILEGFCRDEVIRYVGLSADPALNQNQRDDALRMAHAGGLLKRWIQIAAQQRETSLQSIADYQADLNELLHADPEVGESQED